MRARPLVPSLAALLVACGGEAPPPAAPPPAASATLTGTITAQTPAQHKVAHLRSADGMVALVLDRSGVKPKYRLDGASDIVELTQKEERERWNGQLEGYYLEAPDGKRPIFLDEGGGITFLRGNDHFRMMFDADAPPLGPPTVTGTYAPPPPPYQATVDRLKAASVRARFPQYKAEDAADLTKVGAALAQATADMFVRYAKHAQADWPPRLELVPQAFEGVSFGGVGRESDAPWDPRAKGPGLAPYGGVNEGFSHYDTPRGNHMQVMTLKGYPPALAEGTPGLAWEVDGTRAIFVAADGGRYVVDLSKAEAGQTLEKGAGPEASWPKPAQDALLTVTDVSSLAKAGAMPQKAADDLLALDQDWTTCAAKVWAGVQRQIDTGRFNEADRKDTEKRARAQCGAIIRKQETMLVRAVEARQKERLALFAAFKERVKAAK